MDYGRRNTKKYSFICPDLKEIRKLSSFVVDLFDFKKLHEKLLLVLSTEVVEGLLSVLVQFYDPLYQCFTFPDYQLMPTLDEYAHFLGIPVSNKVSFSGLEEIPRSQVIVDALHLKKSEIDANMMKKGEIQGLTSEFLISRATYFSQVGSMDAFEAIFVFLIYGLALFPNIDNFVNVNAIRIFLIGNPVPTLLGDTFLSLHLRNSKGGGIVRLMSLTNDDIVWCDSAIDGLEIIDSCGELSNVPLIGTQGGINYNSALARRHLGFPLKNKPNNVQLDSLFYQEGTDPQNLRVEWCMLGTMFIEREDLSLVHAIV
ncbi:hypothetical protein KIW84_043665 [Lathyrus oleraceus]|uniref:DUF7745 domain-containing protein n=1 Tax=Pisum sativum TaxID=3888 RepID=A0A9D4XIX8_PEA|nr:hypothetical protein KIW84_043665 [Pisum sativum]